MKSVGAIEVNELSFLVEIFQLFFGKKKPASQEKKQNILFELN